MTQTAAAAPACFACTHQHDPASAGDCTRAACMPACAACADRLSPLEEEGPEGIMAHMVARHDETRQSVRELVEDFMGRHPLVSVDEALEAVHMFQHDSLDWDAGHAH